MIMLTSRHRPSLRRAAILVVFGLTLAAPLPGALASTSLVPKGQKAILEYTIDVEGKASGTNNNYQSQQWSTRRTLAVRVTLIAQQPSSQDPGDPGGPHRAASRPKGEAFQPSSEMAAFMAEVEKCGEDVACRSRLAQKMMQNPKVQADMQKAAKASESSAKGPPRYQVWTADPKTPATGTVKVEVQREQLFKTAVDEHETCREAGEGTLEELMRGGGWPATIKIDAQEGTYAASIGGRGLYVGTKTNCVRLDGRKRSEEHTKTGAKLLPERYQQARPDEIEVFRGRTDAPTGSRRVASGEKALTGLYGSLVGNVPMAAKVRARWVLTLTD